MKEQDIKGLCQRWLKMVFRMSENAAILNTPEILGTPPGEATSTEDFDVYRDETMQRFMAWTKKVQNVNPYVSVKLEQFKAPLVTAVRASILTRHMHNSLSEMPMAAILTWMSLMSTLSSVNRSLVNATVLESALDLPADRINIWLHALNVLEGKGFQLRDAIYLDHPEPEPQLTDLQRDKIRAFNQAIVNVQERALGELYKDRFELTLLDPIKLQKSFMSEVEELV